MQWLVSIMKMLRLEAPQNTALLFVGSHFKTVSSSFGVTQL
jgi:hypothetical protein